MATLAQLEAERWYGAELAPPTVLALGKAVREHFGLTADAIGTKGDAAHLRGYHRSRAWVKNSAYCTNRSYSIKETAGNREGGNDNWVCALDISAPPDVLLPMCARLDAAVRAGRLEKVTEWYGNIDGDKVVDGWNNIADRVASSDSSHLWHLHISFDRGRAGEDHADLLAVLTGTTTKEQDMAQARRDPETGAVWIGDGVIRRHVTSPEEYAAAQAMFGLPALQSVPNATPTELAALGVDVATLVGGPGGVAELEVTLAGIAKPKA